MDDTPKRGRPKKDAAGKPATRSSVADSRREANQVALANTIALVNNLAVGLAGADYLALEESESLLISDAMLAITDEIDISVSPLTQAIINAGTTLIFVYGAKIAMHKMTKQIESDDNGKDKAG